MFCRTLYRLAGSQGLSITHLSARSGYLSDVNPTSYRPIGTLPRSWSRVFLHIRGALERRDTPQNRLFCLWVSSYRWFVFRLCFWYTRRFRKTHTPQRDCFDWKYLATSGLFFACVSDIYVWFFSSLSADIYEFTIWRVILSNCIGLSETLS